MKKRLLSLCAVLALCLSLLPTSVLAAIAPVAEGTAYESNQTVELDGKPVSFKMYALRSEGGVTNYIRLRDLAVMLDGTAAQFNVKWDGSILLEAGKPYTDRDGSENHITYSGDQPYRKNSAAIRVNGKSADFSAFTLNGGRSTYFQLRELADALGFVADWSKERGVYIETGGANRPVGQDYLKGPDGFRTTIDLFTGTVATMALSAEETAICGRQEFKDLTIHKLVVDGTPLYEAYRDDGTVKPLVILMHGGGGHKELEPACDLARAGFRAVFIDCAGHGDSDMGPIDAPAAYAETVWDIDGLIEYYNTLDDVDAASFALQGGSMGGNIAYCYVAHGKYKPVAIVPISSSPDLPNVGDRPLLDCFDHGHAGHPNVWSEAEIRDFAAKYSPLNRPERFLDVWLYAGHGEDDRVTPPSGAKALEAKLTELGGTKFEFHFLAGYGHEGLPGLDPTGFLIRHLRDR